MHPTRWSVQPTAARARQLQPSKQRHQLLALFLLSILFYLAQPAAQADSPPTIVTDIEWDEDPNTAGNQRTFASVTVIEAAYNHAHRQEEIQLGLTTGALGNLDLPPDAEWASLTLNQKALILINAERRARADLAPNVVGLPLSGVDSRLQAIAQHYADHLVQTNTSGHLQDGSPIDRINAQFGDPTTAPTTACREFLPYSEALASFWASSAGPLTAVIEQAVYNWLYRDSSSQWGHRATLLIQDTQSGDQGIGYHNNLGSMRHEGVIGIGHAASANYDPLNWGWPTWGEVIVLNLIDQSLNPDCAPTTGSANLSISRKVAPTPTGSAGQLVTVTLTVANTGSTLLTGLQLTSTIDSEVFSYLSADITPSQIDPTTGRLIWRDLESSEADGTLDPAQALTVNIRLMTTGQASATTAMAFQATAYDAWQTVIQRSYEPRSSAWRLYLPTIVH